MSIRRSGVAALLWFVPALVGAQIGTVTGAVRDSLTRSALPSTLVSLAGNGYGQTMASDADGSFRFTKTTPGTYTLSARRLGYAPVRATITVVENGAPLIILMSRVTPLDTVRVQPGTGIYGEVGTLRTLRPLAGADIQVVGVGTRLKTDSAGRFFLALRNAGAYVVRARMPGYASQTMSVSLRRDSTVGLMMLLDSASGGSSNAYEMAWTGFADRARLRGSMSALVSRSDLLRNGDISLIDAIQRSPGVADKQLRFGPVVCLFIEGRPAAATPIGSLDPESIEAVEVYTADRRSDETRSLARASRGYECNATGLAETGTPDRNRIRWVVIWLKH